MRLRILLCPEYFFPALGGGEVWALETASRLAWRGHDVHVVTYKHPEYLTDQVLRGVQVHRVGPCVVRGVGAYLGRALVQGLGILWEGSKIGFDLVQASQTFPLLPGKLLAKMRRRPIVAVYHDVYGFRFSLADKGFLKGMIRGSVEAIAVGLKYDAVVAVSESTKRKLETLGMAADRIHVIYEGVDLELIDSVAGQRSSYHDVLYVGRLVRHKRVPDLLEAFQQVARGVRDARLTIVGEGPEEPRLRRLCRSLGIESRVEFTGFVSEVQKLRYMKKAHVLVLPSVAEGFGLVLVEAMACKTPVIAADVGGPREVVEPGRSGLLVPPRQPGEIAERLHSLLLDAHLRTHMGEQGRRRVESLFTWDKTVDRLEALYDRVLQSA